MNTQTESKIEIQNQSFELPWIKVKTADDTFGWIYPCPLQVKAINGLSMDDVLRERLLRSLIGVSQWEELQRYNNAFAEADELMAVLDVYKSGRQTVRFQFFFFFSAKYSIDLGCCECALLDTCVTVNPT